MSMKGNPAHRATSLVRTQYLLLTSVQIEPTAFERNRHRYNSLLHVLERSGRSKLALKALKKVSGTRSLRHWPHEADSSHTSPARLR
eukprot:6193696-Pleurochrysis_carterae.AAC.2